ncbi:MAG: hypothetical protein ABJB01_01070 [Rudaea sp.]
MKRFFLLYLLTMVSPFACNARSLAIDESDINFGEKYQFDSIQKEVKIWNTSDQLVDHLVIRKLVGRGDAELSSEKIQVGQYATLRIRVPLEQSVGLTSSRFLLQSIENGASERYAIRVHGYVNSVLEDSNPSVDFGVVKIGAATPDIKVGLIGVERKDIKARRIIEAPDFVSAQIIDNGRVVSLKPVDSTLLGLVSGNVKLALDSDEQRETWIHVSMDFHGDIVPDQNPIEFNLQRPNQRQAIRLEFTSNHGDHFELGPVRLKDVKVDVLPEKCISHRVISCKAYQLTLSKEQPIGQIFGQIFFPISGTKKEISVGVAGLMIGDATEVQPLNKLIDKNAKSSASQSISAPSIAQSIQDAVKKVDDLVPPGRGPLLKWQVGNELAIYGYAIYRSSASNGNYERINPTILVAKNEGDNVTSAYQYRDVSAVPGKEYWYYITIFYNSGKKVQLTGPQKVVAK